MRNFNAIGDFLSNLFDMNDYETDEKYYSLEELCHQLSLHVQTLSDKIEKLEEENVETTNTLYEIMHSIDAVDSRIDIVSEYYNNNETHKNKMGRTNNQSSFDGTPNF